MMPLADGIALGNDGALGLLDGTAHVGLQFRTFHFSIAMDGINLAVVIEEHAQIVDLTLHIVVFPGTSDVF